MQTHSAQRTDVAMEEGEAQNRTKGDIKDCLVCHEVPGTALYFLSEWDRTACTMWYFIEEQGSCVLKL